MPSSLSRATLALLFAAAALSACSSGSSNTCSTTSDCPTGDTCTSGQCLAPGQCPSGVLSCSESAQCSTGNVCTSGCCAPVEGCASSVDCTTATRPFCNTTTHQCIACASNSECSTGKICSVTGACETSCTSDASCSGATPHCVTSSGFCAACTASSQCPASAPFCSNNVCTGCASNTDCAAPTPVCNTSTKSCVTCIDGQNAAGKNSACPSATPACESGVCVACNPASNADGGSNGACAGSTPSCGAASTCVACTSSSECAMGSTCSASNSCTAVTLVSFTSSASTLMTGGTATLTATLNGPVTMPITVNVAIAADGGVQGSLSAATIVISSGTTGTVTYTAPSTEGTAVITAMLAGGSALSANINVTATAATLAGIALVSATPVAPGSTDQATVSLSAAPGADTVVAVSVNNGATINGAATANITVPAGSDVSAPFTIQLACNSAPTTATATLGAATKMVTIPLSAGSSSVTIASLVAASTSVASGAATTLTLTLSGPASCTGARANLLSSNIGFKTENKINSYIPGTITVAPGATSATVTIVPECTTNTTGDVIYFSAQLPGSAPVGITTPITMTAIASGTVGLCPISPVAADRTLTYVQGDGGTAPLPTLLTVGFFASPSSSGAYSVSLTATGTDGGTCGSFTQNGAALAGGKVTLASATKAEISFVPGGTPGACVLAAQGTNPAGTTTYDAGVLSTINLVAFDWTQQKTPTDLILTKAEIDEDSNKVATLSDGGSVFGDATEYIEVYNPTASAVDLSAYTLVFVGAPFDNFDGGSASKSEYWSYALSGMLQPGHYAIAQDANTFAAPPTASTDEVLTWPDAGFTALVAGGLSATSTSGTTGALRDGNIANAPGGIFLVKNAGMAAPAIVDGLTYGAPLQAATSLSITGTAGGIFSWPPAPLFPLDNWITDNSFVKGSLVRIGYTGSPALDWADSTTVTPGAANTVITGP